MTDFCFEFSSEPPDVGKWFSSYVYESPTLNLSQEFGYCESEKTGLDHEMEETQENVRKTKNGGEIVELNLFEKCNGNSRGNRLNNRPLSEVQFSIFFLRAVLSMFLDRKHNFSLNAIINSVIAQVHCF